MYSPGSLSLEKMMLAGIAWYCPSVTQLCLAGAQAMQGRGSDPPFCLPASAA